MVETLLDRFQDSCGFTVVGDAAQAVYGFQIDRPGRTRRRDRPVLRLAACLVPRRTGRAASRSRTSGPRTDRGPVALPVGPRSSSCRRARPRPDGAASALRRAARPPAGPATDFGGLDDLHPGRRCGTSRHLRRPQPRQPARRSWSPSTAARARRRRTGCGARSRIGRCRTGSPSCCAAPEATALTEERFDELLAERPAAVRARRRPPCGARCGGPRAAGRGVLDLVRLHRAVAEGRFPDELPPRRPARSSSPPCTGPRAWSSTGSSSSTPPTCAELRKQHSTTSTPPPRPGPVRGDDPRPRDLYRRAAPDSPLLSRAAPSDRPLVRGWLAALRQVRHRGSGRDVCREHPPGTDGPGRRRGDSGTFWHRVAPGQSRGAAHARTICRWARPEPAVRSCHDGREIGVVSERFREDLYRLQKVNRTWDILVARRDPRPAGRCPGDRDGQRRRRGHAGLGDRGCGSSPGSSGSDGTGRAGTTQEEERDDERGGRHSAHYAVRDESRRRSSAGTCSGPVRRRDEILTQDAPITATRSVCCSRARPTATAADEQSRGRGRAGRARRRPL